jgi:hypothetical protein
MWHGLTLVSSLFSFLSEFDAMTENDISKRTGRTGNFFCFLDREIGLVSGFFFFRESLGVSLEWSYRAGALPFGTTLLVGTSTTLHT